MLTTHHRSRPSEPITDRIRPAVDTGTRPPPAPAPAPAPNKIPLSFSTVTFAQNANRQNPVTLTLDDRLSQLPSLAFVCVRVSDCACVRACFVGAVAQERASKRVVLALVLLHAIRFCSCAVVDGCEGLAVTANFSFLRIRQRGGGIIYCCLFFGFGFALVEEEWREGRREGCTCGCGL
jgi:hypothetical protein